MNKFNVTAFKAEIERKLIKLYGTKAEETSPNIMYKALCRATNDILAQKRLAYSNDVKAKNAKQVYYMSMEFLLGRSLKNHLYNLGILDVATEAVKQLGFNIEELMEIEPDAGLGNGGLGRLAAAYLDSLTSCGYPASGFSIRYDYGIFKQRIVDGWQMEMPDKWLLDGAIWQDGREVSYEVKIGGRVEETWQDGRLKAELKDYTSIIAVPYDMYISGYDTPAVNFLRLWSATAPVELDMALFSRGEYLKAMEAKALAESISKVLYPADNHYEGKMLRLKQQYFFVSASIQNIISRHLKKYKSVENLSKKVAIHINDTHPALCIPELMRVLLDDYNYNWDDAWKIVTETVSYTNHTVMQEALEKWPQNLFETLLPRIFQITNEINRRHCADLWNLYPGDWNKISENSVLADGQVKMANLCLVASHTVNGVSALHSDILKSTVFADAYRANPKKFTNVTNGITHRRWLCEANPLLTDLISELIGNGFKKDAGELEKLLEFQGNRTVLEKLYKIRRKNKERLAEYIQKSNGISVDPDAIFDVQVKRLHEYKRQLLNALQIIDLYNRLKENPDLDIVPRVFIFGAKAASSYYMAKLIIRLIYMIGEMVNNDKSLKGKLKVVFLENYRVSLAELIMPASDISQQISVAGTEASGTGNMKFMINGAVTIGTMDGANVEIHERVGDENIFIFGLLADEVERLYATYSPSDYYSGDRRIKAVIDKLKSGIAEVSFAEISNYLVTAGKADPYLCLADFSSYCDAQARVDEAYKDKQRFFRMCLVNTAKSGFFSADRSVTEYANRIWALKPLK
ncbi:MAG: glycogen/starch/alpha-glucan phosphorylase [Firmicutes bacterium]|nr:glycogen/starch/alpha-glucan phosphorylase [Bacillota bacterium]